VEIRGTEAADHIGLAVLADLVQKVSLVAALGGQQGAARSPIGPAQDAREYARRLRSLPVDQVLRDFLFSLLNAAQVKLGRRDARLLINVTAVAHEHARPYLQGELARQIDQVLGQLRLGQVSAEFSPVRQHRADAGLGWLTARPDALPAPLDAMSLGQFEPDLCIPRSHPAARRGTASLGEMASMDVIHGPRSAEPGTYDAWTSIVRAVDPRFAFTDPPLRHSLPVVLAFAAAADRATAVLTDPTAIAGTPPGVIRLPEPAGTGDMVRVSIGGHPLTATAALVWNGDLPRPLQQIIFDTADRLTRPAPASLSRAG
jgi:hypothetical protein